MPTFNLGKVTALSSDDGAGQWISKSDFGDDGIIIQGALTPARPVNTIVRNTADGELYVSTNATVATYTQLTNTGGGGSGLGVNVSLISGGVITAYGTIGAALAASVSGDVIIVGAGTYAESIIIPSGVRVVGFPASQNVILSGADTTSTRVTISDTATLREITVVGPSTGANPAIDCTGLGLGELAVLKNVVVRGGGGTASGHLVAGAGAGTLVLFNLYHNGGTTTGAFVNITGGTCVIDSVIANLGSASAALDVSGTAVVTGSNFSATGAYASTDGLLLAGTCTVELTSIQFPELATITNALHFASDGVTLSLASAHLHGNTYDVLVDGGLTGTGTRWTVQGEFTQERFSAPATWASTATTLIFVADDGVLNDPAWRVGGELAVGSPFAPYESAFGEGDSHVNDMFVFSDDGTGTAFVDNTTAAHSPTGSTFSVFQSTAVGQVVYIGDSDHTFTGVKTDAGGTALVLGSAVLIWEYWNGVAWTEFNIMVTDADSPYAQKATNAFQEASTSDQIRFDTPTLSLDWAVTTVNGQAAYWVRCRVTSAVLTTVPVYQRFKNGTNRTEINKDGTTEFFGNAEPEGSLVFNPATLLEVFGFGPKDQNLSYSSTVVLKAKKNRLDDGALDGTGGIITIQSGTDTSRPLILKVEFYPTVSVGDMDLEMTTVLSRAGVTVLDGTAAELTDARTVTAGTALLPQTEVYEIDISSLLPGDTIAFAFTRDARAGNDPPDTMAGDTIIVAIIATFTRWR